MLHLLRCVNRIALLAAVTVGSLTAGIAHAEDAVLLASTVPGYMPGMVVSSSDHLSLPDGASATLLFHSGGMLRLRGPFEGTLEQQRGKTAESNIATLADMFRMNGVDATVIGGTRSTAATRAGTVIEDVQVDPQRSGTYCVDPTSTVWLTRPVGMQSTFALRRKGSVRALVWPEGAARSEWPVDVPIDDGSQFEIITDGTARSTITFRAFPSESISSAARIASGILLGCHEQFDEELRRFGRSTATPELWITTDHGRRPVYRKGEPVGLTVTANMDGFLYCIAMGNDGGAAPIFPAGAVDGAQVRGSAPVSIPGRRQAYGLTAGQGLAQIRCWLTDRDVTPELPHALIGTPAGRLPDQLSGDLDALFQRIGGTRIAADIVSVADK